MANFAAELAELKDENEKLAYEASKRKQKLEDVKEDKQLIIGQLESCKSQLETSEATLKEQSDQFNMSLESWQQACEKEKVMMTTMAIMMIMTDNDNVDDDDD